MIYLFVGENKFIQQAIVSADLQKQMLFFYSFQFFLFLKCMRELIALVIKQVTSFDVITLFLIMHLSYPI